MVATKKQQPQQGSTPPAQPPAPKKQFVSTNDMLGEERKVLYPEVEVNVCIGGDALTVSQAKDLLLWIPESQARDVQGQPISYGDDYLLVDRAGEKVRCLNNTGNRPLSLTWVNTLVQDILNRNWVYNGETIVIGKTGRTLSGQHRLISVILAEQERTGKQHMHWESAGWDKPVTLDTTVVFGVDEEDKTTRTLDNVKARSFSDVLFCDVSMFKFAKSPKEREQLARWLDYAVKTLWDRTLAKSDAFKPRRTHSEGLEFIDRHPKLLEALKHIAEENVRHKTKDTDGKEVLGDPPITKLIGGGYAVALMYLMGMSDTDVDVYRNANPPSEKQCDDGSWGLAVQFWMEFARGVEGKLKELYYAIIALRDENTKRTGSRDEVMSLIANAWTVFKDGGAVTPEAIALQYGPPDEWGVPHLTKIPDVGGIDLGGWQKEDEEKDTGNGEGGEPSEEEIKKRADEVQKQRREELKHKLLEARQKKSQQNGGTTPAAPATTQPTAPAPTEQPAPAVPGTRTFQEEIDEIKTANGGALLLFKTGAGARAWGEDATEASKMLKIPRKMQSGMPVVDVPTAKVQDAVNKLQAAGYKVAVVETDTKQTSGTQPEAKQEVPAPANGEQATAAPKTVKAGKGAKKGAATTSTAGK
jgi:hypothetical protein